MLRSLNHFLLIKFNPPVKEGFFIYHIEHLVHIVAHSGDTMCSYMCYVNYVVKNQFTLRYGTIFK
jgi:hypothetical protein